MTEIDPPPRPPRNRLPLWVGLIVLILLFPAVVIPLLVGAFRDPAFASVDEVDVARVQAIDVFILNRPDGGPDIGGTRGLFPVPEADFERVLALMRNATPSQSQRGIWMGRIVVTLTDGRVQTIMLHRPTDEYAGTDRRLEMRIGRLQFDGPPVKEFLRKMGEIAGQDPPPGK